jgi:hypothetical protein
VRSPFIHRHRAEEVPAGTGSDLPAEADLDPDLKPIRGLERRCHTRPGQEQPSVSEAQGHDA